MRFFSKSTLLILLVVSLASSDLRAIDDFCCETALTIVGLPIGSWGMHLSTEEPYVRQIGSRAFLFFSSDTSEGNKDLHFAVWQGSRARSERGQFARWPEPPEIHVHKKIGLKFRLFAVRRIKK